MDTTLPSDAQAAIDAFQDGIIGRRLPPWLRHAPAEQLPEIGRALSNLSLIHISEPTRPY